MLVDTVGWLVQGVRGSSQIHRRTDCRNRPELRRRFVAPFARELQHEIASHGKSGQCKLLDSVHFDDVTSDSSDIRR